MVAPLTSNEPLRPGSTADKKVGILMVDDEPKNLLALEAVLEEPGRNLVKAHSGKEALRCLMREDFAVILLDVQMPEMDGFETAAMIRSRDRTRGTPIVFLTAVGKTEQEVFRGYEAGAVDYLLKPFAPQILRYKVAVLIELHQKTEQIRQLNARLQQNVQELENANRQLTVENQERRLAEEAVHRSEERLTQLNNELERRVMDRTLLLERRGAELARSNQELAQYAAIASHDLQEPLRTMGTYLQLLEQGLREKLDGEGREIFGIVLDSCRRMRQLIRDVQDFSQIGCEEPKPVRVDCYALVNGILGQLKDLIQATGAEVSVGHLPEVYAEAGMLGQVFQNLIGNALKFHKDRPPRIEVGAEAGQSEWRFWIRDNGIGIETTHFDKLFRLFRRLHTRDEYPGSGLGLSICKKIVERHGGKIWLESEVGKGTTFYFTIPDREEGQ